MALFLSLFFSLSAFAWNVNDLSILLPLPKAGEEARMIGPSPALLPKDLYDALPNLLMKPDPETVYKDLLKVVAIRFDACFREGDGPCQKQIRLVWQPVRVGTKVTTLDGAVHTFHTFNDAGFASLVADLRALRLTEAAPALGVHPVLAREGYGPFWEKLSVLVRKHCAGNLTRATMMTSNPRGVIWTFSGFDVVNGQFVRMNIPRTNAQVQSFFATLQSPSGEFRAAMNPEPAGESDFVALLKNSEAAKSEMSEGALVSATRSALRVENPLLSNPGTVDCASCHSAHVIPTWSLANFRGNFADTFAPELYALLDGASPREPANVLRAFGYFKDRPVISRRMRNEAAEAVKAFPAE